ncbi:MAG: substrate-binding domain-containing protein [Opitutaceae bacterium]|jgi:LacI family transcriptional regulator|nr:substrate-binding domain-containing protein [Opitutaceae bacterium]
MIKRQNSASPFRVQLVVGGDGLEYFRNTLLGARHYGFDSGRFAFADRWLAHERTDNPAVLVRRDRIDGIVAAINTRGEEARFLEAGVPVVNLSNSMLSPVLPLVTQDDVTAGHLAAEHLRACGCQSFGFWGQLGAAYSDERLEGFRRALGDTSPAVGGGIPTGRRTPATVFAAMKCWLETLQHRRPLGLFAVLDTLALQLMRAARELGWRVPEEVAVLGAGDDDFWVDFESVPLSSVRLPSRTIGYEAARLLDRLMTRGERGHGEVARLPVSEVAARRSTDVLFVDDPAVSKAVRLIRENRGRLRVAELVRAAGVSRTGLQARFKKALGCSMLEEIHRVKLARAQEMLVTTNQKISAIAEQSGLGSPHRISMLFRTKLGQTPSAFRRERRG